MTRSKQILLTMSIFLAGLLTSCNASSPPETQPRERKDASVNPPVQNAQADKQPVQEKKGKIKRAGDLIEYRNHFKQLGLAYATFETEQGKGPKSKDDLKPYLQGANKVLEMLDKGDIVFFYGVNKQQMEKGASNTILAHEAYEDINGRRLVLMGDGSVQEMSSDEFAKAPKAKN